MSWLVTKYAEKLKSESKLRDRQVAELVCTLDYVLEDCGNQTKASQWLAGQDDLVKLVMAEISRCKRDFRYFAANYFFISTKEATEVTMRHFWDSQEMFWQVYEEERDKKNPFGIRIMVLKGRQLGISTEVEALIFWRTIFNSNHYSLIVSSEASKAEHLFNMFERGYELLPWWMKPERRYHVKGRHLVFDREDPDVRRVSPGLMSKVSVEASSKLSGVARSTTVHSVHMSELAFWADPDTLSGEIFPTIEHPHCFAVMESTARTRNDYWHNTWKGIVHGDLPKWRGVFIEWFRERQYSLPVSPDFKLTKEEEEIREKIYLETTQPSSYRVKGFMDAVLLTNEQFHWRRDKIAEAEHTQGSDDSFYREYPNLPEEAFLSVGTCSFNKRRLMEIWNTQCKPPIWRGWIDLHGGEEATFSGPMDIEQAQPILKKDLYEGPLRVWESPKKGEIYYVGLDVSHGVEHGDYSCGQVFKVSLGPQDKDVQVAEWHGLTHPTVLARYVVALGKLYNMAELAIECSDSVGALTNSLVFRQYQYPNLYRWKHIDKVKNHMTDYFGWYTNHRSKGAAVATFRERLIDDRLMLRSNDLIDECFSFVSTDAGNSWGAASDSHDDRVMAAIIAVYCAQDCFRDPSELEELRKIRETYKGRRYRVGTETGTGYGTEPPAMTNYVDKLIDEVESGSRDFGVRETGPLGGPDIFGSL